MDVVVATSGGKDKTKRISLSDEVFACDFNEALVHQVVTAYLAGGRSGSKKQKSRSEVRGGGKKPWRQKGTGRARAGTIRSPIWRSGGRTFAAKPRDFSQKVNKKMYRGAMSSILSELVRQERLLVVDGMKVDAPKTKELAEKLKKLGLEDVLIVVDDLDDNLALASRNLFKVEVCSASEINPVALLSRDKVVMTVDAVKKVEGMFA